MTVYLLKIMLLSDTTIGRGDGLAGLVDQEVEHDVNTGLPYLRGRTLKGLLSEECDAIAALDARYDWNAGLQRLFGNAGSTRTNAADWHFGDARLPDDLQRAIAHQISTDATLTAGLVLDLLTTIRRQTSIDAVSGRPAKGSLRAARAIRRNLTLTSRLTVGQAEPNPDDLQLLAAGALALRRLGSGRNRGRGAVRCRLTDAGGADITATEFGKFAQKVKP